MYIILQQFLKEQTQCSSTRLYWTKRPKPTGSTYGPQNLNMLGWDFLLLKVRILHFSGKITAILLICFLTNYKLFVDLPKYHCIPYFGVFYLHDVASEDSNDPLELPPHLCDIWNRLVVLGNQPIVHEENSVVRVWSLVSFFLVVKTGSVKRFLYFSLFRLKKSSCMVRWTVLGLMPTVLLATMVQVTDFNFSRTKKKSESLFNIKI